jgi:hypothetical protein
MNLVRHRLFAVCLLLLVVTCREETAVRNEHPEEATVCAIAKAPNEFHQRVVRLRARVVSDGIEQTVLVDRACPDVGIALGWGARVTGASSLTDVLYGSGRSPHADIEATVVGLFLAEDGGRRLEASQVSDVTVRRVAGAVR